MRKMGLDYGDVRIGVALSDMMGIIANGVETYVRKTEQEDLDHIDKLIKDNLVDTVVLGLPKNMDGSEGDRVELTKQFGQKIEQKSNVKVTYLDERLSSISAEKLLIQADVRREKRKQVIDKIAATIILQNYLDIYSK